MFVQCTLWLNIDALKRSFVWSADVSELGASSPSKHWCVWHFAQVSDGNVEEVTTRIKLYRLRNDSKSKV